MVSARVLEQLGRIAGRIPDEYAAIGEPVVAAWGDIRLGLDDADELLAAVELAEWVQEFIGSREGEAAAGLLLTWVRLLKQPATMETLQMIQRRQEAQCD